MSKKVKEVQGSVGYGFGTTIGCTNDGLVFVVSDTQGPEGKPMQSTMIFSPERAESVATSLADAAMKAKRIQQEPH